MNSQDKTVIGSMPNQWKDGASQNLTFTLTEDCNLRCKYCYMSHKNNFSKMPLEIAKKAVDFFLSDRTAFPKDSVILDFIGGEPFLEVELMDQITDYFKREAYKRNHPWFSSYRLNISTNGLLYDTREVQRYIKKNHHHLSIGISVDGGKIKHDLQRVRPDGTGSFDDIKRIIPLWLEQFPVSSTKSTFSHSDLPFLKDSVIELWNLGIRHVIANVVFEDVWHEGDDVIFENQIKELGNYILENGIWKEEYSVRFLNPDIGFPLNDEERKRNYCGSGNMIAVDSKGYLFPCVRFQSLSLSNNCQRPVGNIFEGINKDLVRPFLALNMVNQSPQECRDCNVASGCALCVGNNYDGSQSGSIFNRTTFTCKMHKANVRASEYFWQKFEKVTGLPSERSLRRSAVDEMEDKNYLFILTSDAAVSHCVYHNRPESTVVMNNSLLERGLDYAMKNGYIPVLIEGDNCSNCHAVKDLCRIAPASSCKDTASIPVYDNFVAPAEAENNADNCILRINKNSLYNLSEMISELSERHRRINIILHEIVHWSDADIETYSTALRNILPIIVDSYKSQDPLELNVLTDALNLSSMCNCNAGCCSMTLAPDGKLYPCPAFYFDPDFEPIGDLEHGITFKELFLFDIHHSGICHECMAYHCKRCIYLNKKSTREITTPSRIQCVISHIELQRSYELQEKLFAKSHISEKSIAPVNHFDPLEIILNGRKGEVVCL